MTSTSSRHISPRHHTPPRSAAVLIALAALGFAACGGGSGGSGGSGQATSPSTVTAPATEPATEPPTSPVATTEAAPTSTTQPVNDSILSERRTGSITLDGVVMPFSSTDIDTELNLGDGPTAALIGLVDDGDGGAFFVEVDLATESATGLVVGFTADGATVQAPDATVGESGDDGITASGTFDDGAEFALELSIGAGSSQFELDGSRAILTGDLGSTTFEQVQHLIENHPEIDTIVLQEVPGSVNDEINVETGRLVRNAGYTTIIPSDGLAASGGVDLFAAGVERIAERGAQVGIHSWCCTDDGSSPADLPRDDPQHALQVAYFTEMLGADDGPDFYFQTLAAAPFDDIHYMTDEELAASTIATNR